MEATDCVCVLGILQTQSILWDSGLSQMRQEALEDIGRGRGAITLIASQQGKEGVGELHLEDRTQDGAGWLCPSSANQSKCGGKGKGVGSSKSVSKKNQEELKFSETWGVWVRPRVWGKEISIKLDPMKGPERTWGYTKGTHAFIHKASIHYNVFYLSNLYVQCGA